ncbi:hypothetical protein I3842_05G155800 [Carya illinoinensis]|uniref:Reverse transcriptase n=1 Tax=Carya illinoinensis TaxID=32201 RepID=A0A922F085_CARIL|nr:hypothetical protein I3842_05G155800 [Carya illinoinensis]
MGNVENNRCGASSFKFQRMWVSHPLFMDCVKQSWDADCALIGLRRLAFKIKGQIKIALKSWNFQIFGNICQNLAKMRNKIQRQHHHLLLLEEFFLEQKRRVVWLKEGDRNSKLVHQMLAYKRRKILRRGCVSTSHLYFADDILIFTNGSRSSLAKLFKFLATYEKASRQINTLFFHPDSRTSLFIKHLSSIFNLAYSTPRLSSPHCK